MGPNVGARCCCLEYVIAPSAIVSIWNSFSIWHLSNETYAMACQPWRILFHWNRNVYDWFVFESHYSYYFLLVYFLYLLCSSYFIILASQRTEGIQYANEREEQNVKPIKSMPIANITLGISITMDLEWIYCGFIERNGIFFLFSRKPDIFVYLQSELFHVFVKF